MNKSAAELIQGAHEGLEERVRARTHELLESAPDAMVIVNRDGLISLANSQTERLFGYPRNELLDREFDVLLPERFRASPSELLSTYAAQSRLRPMGSGLELYGRRKDASEFPIEISLRPGEGEGDIMMIAAIRDVTGRKEAMAEIRMLNEELERRVHERTAELERANAALGREIAERAQTEDKLFRSLELFRNLVENISEIYYITDGFGKLVYGSPNLYQRSGFTVAELVGRSYVRLIAPEDRRRVIRFFAEQTARGTVDSACEFRVLKKDGTVAWVEQSTRFMRNPDGSVAEYRNLVRDISLRKNVEAKLLETQGLIQGIIDNSTAVIYVKDLKGRYLLINKRFLEIFHFSSQAVIGKTDLDIFPTVTAHQFRANDLQVLRMGAPLEREELAPHDDGAHTYISLKVPLFDASGAAYGICGISTDITDRKRGEDELCKSRERYRVFFENSPISLWEEDFSEAKRHIDAARSRGIENFREYFETHPEAVEECASVVHVMDVNQATLRAYRAASKSDFLTGLRTVLSPDSHAVFREELIAIAEGANVFESEDVNTTLDGHRINIHLKWSVAPGSETTYSRVLVSIIDITERKAAEDQIKLLAQALESTTEMICITNLENRIIFVNKAFLSTYGYSEREILGSPPSVLRSSRTPASISAQIFEQSRSHGWSGELLNLKHDGTEFPVYLSTSPIRDSEGNVLGLIGVARDISDITQAEEILWHAASGIEELYEGVGQQMPPLKPLDAVQTDPAKRKHDLARDISDVVGKLRTRAQRTLSFSSLASHQLRTPLTILRSQLENALRPDLPAAVLRKTLGSTYDEILHLSHIVDVLLSLSRMQAGSMSLDVQDVELASLLREFHREGLLLARDKKIAVSLHEGPQVFIQADPGQLRQVLLNLLDNAIKYTPVKGQICLRHDIEGNEAVFRISNTGPAIAPEMLPRIFDPFKSGEHEETEKRGTGLGLALVKWIVESHRGSVEAQSTEREGTTFTVRLPIGPIAGEGT
jgi:PAS domain S-box-containing protein